LLKIRRHALVALAILFGSMVGCGPNTPPVPVTDAAVTGPVSPDPASAALQTNQDSNRRDLAADEAHGGHTLARHTSRTDQQLTARLKQEREISAASTYTDRPTAERVVGAALARSRDQVERWRARNGPRPNLTLHYRDLDGPIGRSVRRGRRRSESCDRALVVLKWDQHRNQYFVLTSYPETGR
jgi:hypothetical protein